MSGDRAPSPMRNLLIAWSSDEGKTWSSPQRVNSGVEAVQGEENGPKVAFDAGGRAYVVWSIPGAKGDKTRANIRFAMQDGQGGFIRARTLNEVQDAARFPIIEAVPDGTFLIAWIDRRIDNPKPRQLYLMKIGADGTALSKNYQVGEGLCECCKLGVAFADGGRTVYLVDRQVDARKIRNHVLRKSTDGGRTFGAPVEISDDGWQVPSCPHSGPSLGRDSRGWLHVSWFTLGRSENEAGIYYSVSQDGGKSFAPRRLVDANRAPEILYNNLAVGDDDTVYFAWSNLDGKGRSQIYLRALAADGQSWSPVQQVSNAKGNASRPALALRKNQLHIAWTETDGEDSRVVLRNASVRQ
ncbi:MAG TPA: sialidase family protein [Candidatus Binatia bacterium]|nr:sialidase family protein [Candidatus Binatia bacterium]